MLQVFQAWGTVFKQSKWLVVLLVSFLLVCCLLLWSLQRTREAEKQFQQAIVIQQDQMTKVEELSKDFQISERNSKKLQAAYEKVLHMSPAASFTVQAKSIDAAAKQVAELINQADKSLPPATLEKSDRTAVVPNVRDYKVDVLKINLNKSWELSTGVGWHQGDIYLPVGVQRNYSANKAVAVEMHLVPAELAKRNIKTSGWEGRHVWRF